MIKFFRKIRYKLLEEGKLKKYLIYAAGEIILVMVGILLALQVNNWNMKNKERIDQLKQLSNLRLEIESMQEFLRFQISTLESAKEGTKPLLELMGPQASMNILPDSINHLIFKAVNTDFVTAEKLSFETQINFESMLQSQEVFAKLYHRNFRINLLIHDLKGGLDQLDQMLIEII